MRITSSTILPVVLLLSASTPGHAVSCDGRLDPAAKALCANPDAKLADDRMSAAFQALHAGLPGPAAAMLLNDQRDWLGRRNGICDGSDKPVATCLRDMDDARTRDLRGEAAAGPGAPGRLVPLVVVQPGTAKLMERRLFLFRFADPSTPGQSAFNALVDAALAKVPADAAVDAGSKGTYTAAGSIAYASPRLLSIRVDGSEFVQGAAHGMSWTSNINVDLQSGRAIAAGDVLDGAGLKKLQGLCAAQVAAQVKANLKEAGQDPDSSAENAQSYRGEVADMRKDVDTVTADPAHWQFDADALVVTYDQDAVASHAEGAFSCRIPYATLRGFAKPGAPLPEAMAHSAGGAAR